MTIDDIAALYPGLPVAARQAYYDAFIAHGEDSAWAYVRQDPRYESWFPGNLTPEGETRYSEGMYLGIRESYRDVLRSVGLNDTAFEDQMTQLMINEVAPTEFKTRVTSVYDRVVSASAEIQARFAAGNNGAPISIEMILASAFDPGIGDMILQGNISQAEIAGAGDESGFNLDLGAVDTLIDRGLELDEARSIFGQAKQLVPILDVLAKRHNDPDDDFDVNEFLSSTFFNDPQESYRMRRLVGQERASFGVGGAFAGNNESLTGLRES